MTVDRTRMKGALVLAALVVTVGACGRGVTTPGDSTRAAPPKQAEAQPRAVDRSIHVVTLGESLAYGAGDESGNGIAGRLQTELERRGLEGDTTNLGVNGAHTEDLIAKLRQSAVRQELARADAMVLSIGANDLFRTSDSREATLRDPSGVAERILERIDEIVAELHRVSPQARILILGGYNPVPKHRHAALINRYLALWDATLAARYEEDPLVAVVTMSDLVDPERLSRLDSFHPGGDAYQALAGRIASMLTARI